MHVPILRHPISWLACVLAGATLAAAGAGPAPVLDLDTTVHVASRLTFGATATTVERLRADGLDAWLTSQLRDDRLPDPALDARLATLTTLALTPRQLAKEYYLPALERRRAMQARMQAGEAAPDPDASAPAQPLAMARGGDGQRAARQVLVELTTQKLVRATTAERQLEEVLVDFWFTTSTSSPTRVRCGSTPTTSSARPFVRTSSDRSARCSAQSPGIRPCSSTWTTGRAAPRAVGRCAGQRG